MRHCFRVVRVVFLLVVFLDFCLGAEHVFAQTVPYQTMPYHSVEITNPSFEGTPQRDYPPLPWRSCDWTSTPDIQPIWNGNTQTPSDGKTYLALVCRGETGVFPLGSYESVFQSLPLKPVEPGSPFYGPVLKRDSAYCFFIDLCFPGPSSGSSSILSPAIFRLWATEGTNGCTPTELLWTSPVIDHREWRTYKVQFTPRQTAYFSLAFDCYFAQMPFYHGGIFLDNIHQQERANLLGKDTLVCYSRTYTLRPDFHTMESDGIIGQDTTGEQFVYQWSDGSWADSLLISQPGIYWVKASDGCVVYQDSIQVSFTECEDTFRVPNVITPNGDKDNEVFRFEGIGKENWQLQVYNRWGKLVYQSRNYQQDWSAEGLPAGIYYYHLAKTGFRSRTGWLEVLK
ncbi:gliding motility-associated C-terminal domain-containing protein [Cytophagaceae bacterium DM2B3-1]|uniref:Gliding motility-associated C-terminal domain-containing protein n=1 Tax=Xanthocytophaga flava TaxID=3048013 RepID=A0ABT7CXY3_9BACT|nr:gliding motility-associated C-terminal domain-containing protein [Xanthocytophaga flavus]MDJ1498593.1 gliding motility-associated C-terminal domain-containing protein [Xanthocytophaga flavus]